MDLYTSRLLKGVRLVHEAHGTVSAIRGRVRLRFPPRNKCPIPDTFYEFVVTHTYSESRGFQEVPDSDAQGVVILAVPLNSLYRNVPHLSKCFNCMLLVKPWRKPGACAYGRHNRCHCNIKNLHYYELVLPVYSQLEFMSNRLMDIVDELQPAIPGFEQMKVQFMDRLKPWIVNRSRRPVDKALLVHLQRTASHRDGKYHDVLTRALMPLLSHGAKESVLGILTTLFGLGALDLPTTHCNEEMLEIVCYRLAFTRFDPMSIYNGNLMCITSCLDDLQRALIYPITYMHEDVGQLTDLIPPTGRETPGVFEKYVRMMEMRFQYQRFLMRHDTWRMPIGATEFSSFFGEEDLERIQEEGRSMTTVIDPMAVGSLDRLQTLLDDSRVRVHAALHLPSQMVDIAEDYMSTTIVCPNRGIQIWLMKLLHPLIVLRFEDLLLRQMDPRWVAPARLTVVWAHMLGAQQWLHLLETSGNTEITFLASFFGSHTKTPSGRDMGLFLDIPGYGTGNVFTQLLQYRPELIKVLQRQPGASGSPCTAYKLSELAYEVLCGNKTWSDAQPALALILQNGDTDRRECYYEWYADDPLCIHLSPYPLEKGYSTIVGHAAMSHQTGEIYVRDTSCREEGTYHMCRCYVGSTPCNPSVRYVVYGERNATRLSMPDNSRSYLGCLKSTLPCVSAHTHVMLDLQVEALSGAPLAQALYTGCPADRVVVVASPKGTSLVQIARAACHSYKQVICRTTQDAEATPPVRMLGELREGFEALNAQQFLFVSEPPSS